MKGERPRKKNPFFWMAVIIGLVLLVLFLILKPLSAAVDVMEGNGVSQPQIVILLMVPIIAFLIVVFRNLIGLKTFGIFTPALLAVAFLATGPVLGLVLFGILLAVGSGVRLLFERYPLLAFPRMGVVLSAVAFTVFMLLFVGSLWGISSLAQATVLPLVIFTMIIERFITVQEEESPQEAARLTLNTLVVAAIVFLVLELGLFENWLIRFPEASILAVYGNILIGRWTGLRLTEYWRFRGVKHAELY
ncbi:MAG: hypothetical protein JSW28_05595 [Thermoplasmata archaeon]|nr:MAG: hypothetical protein JSW28_05595 [Thermoplasmata archaeon]